MSRYADYINADYGCTFAEYLGIDTHWEYHRDGYRFVSRNKGLYGPVRKTKKEAKAIFKQYLKEGRSGYFI